MSGVPAWRFKIIFHGWQEIADRSVSLMDCEVCLLVFKTLSFVQSRYVPCNNVLVSVQFFQRVDGPGSHFVEQCGFDPSTGFDVCSEFHMWWSIVDVFTKEFDQP